MKLLKTTLLVFALIALVSTLHLSKETEEGELRLKESEHMQSYYGKHYRTHRSAEYVHRIVQENLKMINEFNTKNQKVLRSAGPGSNVSGGNSFTMEANKFVEFNQKEFDQTFKGAKLPADAKRHDLSEHQQNHQSEQTHDAEWVFQNPYSINDKQLDQVYGTVNAEDNYGWEWQKFDKNYYNDFSDDPKHYWDDWEMDHQDANKRAKETWYGNWQNEEKKNQNNSKWWNDDSFNSSGKAAVGKRAIAEYPRTAVQVNWNLKKATTHIKDQGECGSCWSFSTIGIVESYLLIMGQGRMDLSEQQLVDCQTSGSYGCDGGWPKYSLDWVSKNGLVAESKYPYRGVQSNCIHNIGPHKIPASSQVAGRAALETALRKGPVVAAVHSGGFQFYGKGIFDKCLNSQADHAIIVVGFTKDYWIIRNSWGPDWGEDGHIRVKKNQNSNNACSIESYVFAIKY